MPIGFRLDDITFSPDALAAHPQHAASLGQTVTSFAVIEGTVGGIYGVLKHTDIGAALDELKNLPTNSSRVQAVRKEIAANPPSDGGDNLDAVMKRVLTYAEERNKIAHGVWGTRIAEPDIIYRLPVKKWLLFVAALVSSGTAGNQEEQIDKLRLDLEEYSLTDLHALAAKGEALLAEVLEAFTALAREAAKADGWKEE